MGRELEAESLNGFWDLRIALVRMLLYCACQVLFQSPCMMQRIRVRLVPVARPLVPAISTFVAPGSLRARTT